MAASTSASATAVPSWPSYPFFETSPVKDVHDLASPPAILKNPHELSVLAPSSLGILMADISGNIIVLDDKFEPRMTWVAFSGGRVTHMVERQMVLITVGDEDGSTLPIMKIFHLDQMDPKTNSPLLMRSVKIQHGNRPYPVSAIAVSTSLSHLAIGLADGAVLLYRHLHHSLFNGSTSLTALPKARLIHEDVTEPVTGLGFRDPSAESHTLYLFVVTTNRVLAYQASGKGSGGTPAIVDEVGAALDCSVMDWKARDMVVARDEAIYLCGPEGRGNSFAYEGHKSSVHTHLNYLVIVSPPFVASAGSNSATVRNYVARTAASNTDISKVTVFDLENKFVAHSSTFEEGVRAVVSGWEQVFVLSNDGQLTKLVEKSTSAKLDMLYAKQQYSTALGLARTQGLEASKVADIHRRYGDHLYSKGSHDAAMQQYLKTIGHVQSSYIVRKFLDAQRIHNLVNYLQELHNLGLANSDHTTLLLNTYTKLKDVARLDSFIKTESRRVSKKGEGKDYLPFDLDTVIRVCRQAGYFDHASYLAKKYNRHEDYLRIQIEDAFQYKDALEYLRRLDPESTELSLTRYGRALLANLPDETTRLLVDICTGTATTPEEDAVPVSTSKASSGGPSYLSYLALGRGVGPGTDLPAAPSPSPSVMAKKSAEPSNQLPVSRQASTHERSAAASPAPPQPSASTSAPIHVLKPKPAKLPSPKSFFAHFIEHMDKFVLFLEAVALRRWGYNVEGNASGAKEKEKEKEKEVEQPEQPVEDEEADKQDQVAVCNTLLEIYLTLAEKNSSQEMQDKALRLIKSTDIPYDQTHALMLCSMRNFTPGLVYIWEKMGMYEDVLRFWMEKAKQGKSPDASVEVIRYLNQYGPQYKHLYPLVLRFLTSDSDLLSRHAQDLEKILDYITAEKIMPPLAVVQILSRNRATTIGLVKKWLIGRIQESRDEIQADRDLYNSYREETNTKLKQIAELSDPNNPKIFHVTRCSACSGQLDLPTVHFMCNHSYHQRCLIGQENECPVCARSHAVLREIRRNNEKLATRSDLFLSEVQENGFAAIANAFGRGVMKQPRPTD